MDGIQYLTVDDIPDHPQEYYPDTDPAAVMVEGIEQEVIYCIPADQIKTERN